MGPEAAAAEEARPGEKLSVLPQRPPDACAALVLAHGAGAGMAHPFMAGLADDLAAHGIATLRFDFPFMARGSKRPDPPAVAHAAVRAAVALARQRWPDLPLFAGGKSFGGRMTTQAQAAAPLEGVRGIVLAGFPLHPAGRPGIERAAHLLAVGCPMLFVQGTHDKLAEPALLQAALQPLGTRATLSSIAQADHAFHVPARSGRTDDEVRAAVAELIAGWCRGLSA